MDDDKMKTDNEEIGDQEQEDGTTESACDRQPLSIENLVYFCLRGRGRRSTHKRRHSEGEGADNRPSRRTVLKAGEMQTMQREARPEEARLWGDRTSSA